MSADPDVLRGLLRRLNAATGPDRALDVRILAHLQQPGQWAASDIEYACAAPNQTCDPPRYTASVDAALALMECTLPGWDVHFYRDDDDNGRYVSEMVWPDGTVTSEAGYFGITGRGLTRPISVLAGIVDAKLTLAHQASPSPPPEPETPRQGGEL